MSETHRNPRPRLPKQLPGGNATRNPRPHVAPHVALLLELDAYGWRVTEIRPDSTEPVLWRVTIRRHDGDASISVLETDPDTALLELARYAAVDAAELRLPIVAAEAP